MSIETITNWDWADEEQIPDGYDWTTVPKCTQANFILLVAKVNELTEALNAITEEKEKS